MLIITVLVSEVMETKDERETQKKQRQKRTRGADAIIKGWEVNDFVVHSS